MQGSSPPAADASRDAVIETRGLTKDYGGHRGVFDLDLSVARGEIFGYLGPNGAGKTTTIRLLLDLIRPNAGEARVLGLPARERSIEIRRRIGYLPGELRLYDSLSGQEMLAYFGHLRRDLDWPRVRALADALDCDISREIRTLSHGNRQKLGLIQAFMSQPELLILDEPTTGLDPLVQHAFFGLVEEIRAAGTTVFLSSHVLPEVERLCDRVALIRDGVLVTVDTVEQLKRRALRQLELQFGGPVPADPFFGLPGIRDLEVEGDRLRCSIIGSVDPLMKAANQYEIVNVTSIEPSLEEVFLAAYGEGTLPEIAQP